MSTNGRLERIWIKRSHGGPMDPVDSAVLQAGKGIEGDANHGGTRQVTVIELDRWKRVQEELGAEVDPALRRANLLVSGVDLVESRGRILRVGKVRIRLKGETRPCGLMDELHPGLRGALDADWGGGAHGEVLDDAAIVPGDPVRWDE